MPSCRTRTSGACSPSSSPSTGSFEGGSGVTLQPLERAGGRRGPLGDPQAARRPPPPPRPPRRPVDAEASCASPAPLAARAGRGEEIVLTEGADRALPQPARSILVPRRCPGEPAAGCVGGRPHRLSDYLRTGRRAGSRGGSRRGWKTQGAAGGHHRELWQRLEKATAARRVVWPDVKGRGVPAGRPWGARGRRRRGREPKEDPPQSLALRHTRPRENFPPQCSGQARSRSIPDSGSLPVGGGGRWYGGRSGGSSSAASPSTDTLPHGAAPGKEQERVTPARQQPAGPARLPVLESFEAGLQPARHRGQGGARRARCSSRTATSTSRTARPA